MADWLFASFAYFGMLCAAVLVIGGAFIGFLSLRQAP